MNEWKFNVTHAELPRSGFRNSYTAYRTYTRLIVDVIPLRASLITHILEILSYRNVTRY